MSPRQGNRYFGSVRALPSGRLQARYVGPDGVRHTAPKTFDSRKSADAWLSSRRAEITAGTWLPPASDSPAHGSTFTDYSETWLAQRELKPRTRLLYRSILDEKI